MPDYQSIEQQFPETLGLERHPAAVKFQSHPPGCLTSRERSPPVLQLLAARRQRADVLHGPR